MHAKRSHAHVKYPVVHVKVRRTMVQRLKYPSCSAKPVVEHPRSYTPTRIFKVPRRRGGERRNPVVARTPQVIPTRIFSAPRQRGGERREPVAEHPRSYPPLYSACYGGERRDPVADHPESYRTIVFPKVAVPTLIFSVQRHRDGERRERVV